MYKREIKQMVLKSCTGCIDREANLHAASMHPESLDDAIRDILRFQFNYAAVYGSRGERGPSDVTVRAVRSSRGYGGGWSSGGDGYRSREDSPNWGRAQPPQRSRVYSPDWVSRRDFFPGSDRSSYRYPTERRDFVSPVKGRVNGSGQSDLKRLLNGMVAGLESRLGALLEDKFSQFASRIENKLSILSHKVEQMDGGVVRLEGSHRSPSPQKRSTSPLTCHGCGQTGHFVSHCPNDPGRKSLRFGDTKKGSGSA
ncbi:hypothetical protein PoB_005619200 [Plakobranchus ocellatus]|uniref:CCHC-type domain-containing protein n=1 Tax=Plakobranchus ocellatus TaxID=259542 RepID=A0AAV4CEN9_9GAST|nr:hypothetical protein PoB_005619200 [Plakobranchus ocellatus]